MREKIKKHCCVCGCQCFRTIEEAELEVKVYIGDDGDILDMIEEGVEHKEFIAKFECDDCGRVYDSLEDIPVIEL